MGYIFIIAGIIMFFITIKIIISSAKQNNQTRENTDNEMTIKDGINLYFGKVIGKLIIIIVIMLLFIIIPILFG